MKYRPIACSCLIASALLSLCPVQAEARAIRLKYFMKTYPQFLRVAKKLKCGVCHPGKSKKSRNEYSRRLERELRKLGLPFTPRKEMAALRKVGPPKHLPAECREVTAKGDEQLRSPTLPARLAARGECETELSLVVQKDVADVASEKRTLKTHKRMTYFLIPPAAKNAPRNGYGLVVLLPGGSGSAAFHPFIKRIRKHAVPDDLIVAQPVAVKWTDTQRVVWPTEQSKVDKQEFSTEAFIDAVIKDVESVHRVDAKRVYAMGWSSSGPAIYAAAFRKATPLVGSYIMMSVYKPQQLPPVQNAKGRRFYIEHSPDDRVCPLWMAKKAHQQLKQAGARVTFSSYKGGHGFRGNIYGRMKTAFQWLETKDED